MKNLKLSGMTAMVFVFMLFSVIFSLLMLFPQSAYSQNSGGNDKGDRIKQYQDYRKVVEDTANMTSDSQAQKIASIYGLQILNLTWEDTGRYKNSAVGPNISDMTIQVQLTDPKTEQYSLYCMPVIRFPNFEDKSCDVNPEKFYLLVGNEKGKALKKITLKEFLSNPRLYLSNPKSWKGSKQSLLAKRDTHVLVSAQACFLPIPKKGIAEFNPVLFNYQSYAENPAVLTILATREGTSVTIIDNQRDAFQTGNTWGQRLFFNQNGERASLTGKRLSDYKAENTGQRDQGQSSASEKDDEGMNMVLLIQVPLKHKQIHVAPYACEDVCPAPTGSAQGMKENKSDVENAVIGHGKVEGPFTEIDNLAIERDENFPVRVTVQFYKATGNGVVSHTDMALISRQIAKVYADGDYVGSLVTSGETGRPTEYNGSKDQPPGWWDAFWKQYEKQFGISRYEAMKRLRKIYGDQWEPRDQKDLQDKLNKMENK